MGENVETRGDGRVDLIVADTNHDGKPDLWVSDTDGDGKADLFQFDTDGDGKVDVTMVDIDQDGTAGDRGRRRRRACADRVAAVAASFAISVPRAVDLRPRPLIATTSTAACRRSSSRRPTPHGLRR